MIAAVARGWFRMTEAPPWVLDDVLAVVLTGPAWREIQEQLDLLFPGPIGREARAAVRVRGRPAEDRLEAGAFTQYVILGAGLDSFAWRRPDLLRCLRVFEVDHPTCQACRRRSPGTQSRWACRRRAGATWWQDMQPAPLPAVSVPPAACNRIRRSISSGNAWLPRG
jgi:hypothetical protein